MAKVKAYLKFIFLSIFFLPSTLMHEGMHALFSLLTGAKIVSISLAPKISFNNKSGGYDIVYGSVRSVPRLPALHFIVAVSPIFLWAVLYIFLHDQGYVFVGIEDGLMKVEVDFSRFFQADNWWIWFLSLQLFYGGFLSRQDLKVALESLCSISAAVIAITIFLLSIW